MKHTLLLTAALAAFLVGCGPEKAPTPAPAPAAAKPSDAKLLQGDWVLVKAELAGQPFPDAVLKSISLKLGDGTYEVIVGDKPDRGTFEVDASTTPKGMVIQGTVGPNAGKTFPAIYEVEGDQMRICYDLSSAARPVAFKSEPGTKLYLVTYRRKP
jgi:uncharacterized protein (TIGR03067 family)